jgi:hypothetical protein
MTLYDFSLLTRSEQIDVLYRHGVYIGKSKKTVHTIVLYQIDTFYIEIIYKKYRCFVDRVHAFNSTAGLDAYLEDIDVEELVKCRDRI